MGEKTKKEKKKRWWGFGLDWLIDLNRERIARLEFFFRFRYLMLLLLVVLGTRFGAGFCKKKKNIEKMFRKSVYVNKLATAQRPKDFLED